MTIHGIELRYVLTMYLALNGPASVAEMIDALRRQGFCFRGRTSKAISDALRWEMGRDRVRRISEACTGRGTCRARPSTESASGSWPYVSRPSCRCEAGKKPLTSQRRHVLQL